VRRQGADREGAGDAALTAEEILDAAERVLRRFGPAKATVVDVARALGVSHGSVYRHFPSKAALRAAVVERWLVRVSAPLAAIAAEPGPALPRLERWLRLLIETKRRKVLDDPEMFAAYHALVLDAPPAAVTQHIAILVGQIARILADGVAAGEIAVADGADAAAVGAAARAVLDATGRFHNPTHAGEWSSPAIAAEFGAVWRLMAAGLRAGGTNAQGTLHADGSATAR